MRVNYFTTTTAAMRVVATTIATKF